jgi:hypothetical protein
MSVRIQYFYKLLKLAQYQTDNRTRESTDLCLEIINLLMRNDCIKKKYKIGMAYGNLSKCLIYQREYSQAAQTARAAQMYFGHETLNYIVTLEQEFFACFYGRDYKRSQEVLNLMTSNNRKDSGSIRIDKYTYFQGCLDFAQGKFREAKVISNLSLSILRDKANWDLGLRYLKIMSQIELTEFEEARISIDSLRKHISRYSEEGKVGISDRDIAIYKALNELSRNNFNKTSSSLPYSVKKLGFKDSSESWKQFNHELIPIHKWMISWMRGKISKKRKLSP